MAKIEQKKPIVEEIGNIIADADSIVLVNYSGLNVAQDTELRKSLRESGITYKVYKNTMMNFAFEGTACEELRQHLEGTNAIAVSKDDATAPARVLANFAKKNPQLELIAGIVEGAYYDQKGVEALSTIPTKEELLGRLFGSMQSPISNLARVLNQIAEKGGEAAPAEAAAEEAPAEAAEAPAEAAPAEEPAEAPAEEAPAEATETPAEEKAEEPAEETPAEAPTEEAPAEEAPAEE